jgi:signal transduction histidine kinase
MDGRLPHPRGPAATAPPVLGTAVATLGAALAAATLLFALVPGARLGHLSLPVQTAFETTAALTASLVCFLMAARFTRTGARHDLLLAASLGVLALSNVFFGVLPNLVDGRETRFGIWSSAFGTLVGSGALAYAAFAPATLIRRPRRAAASAALAVVGAVGLIAALVGAWAEQLPLGIDATRSPVDVALAAGSAGNLTIQLASAAGFAAATVGLARRARREGDELMAWFALGTLLAAVARVHYFLFASSQSAWISTSDVLRMAFYVVLVIGAAREIRAYQRNLARLAAADERRRVARDLHDGLAQDLAFIASMGDQVQRGRVDERQLGWLGDAAKRAMAESRSLIEALTTPEDAPLEEQLRQVAGQAAARAGVEVELDVAGPVEAGPAVRQALVRIVREAVTNAARHSGCAKIRVEVADEPVLRARVVDDGDGFDVSAAAASGRFGLTSMRERARALGGELHVRSAPGRGTVVELVVP